MLSTSEKEPEEKDDPIWMKVSFLPIVSIEKYDPIIGKLKCTS